jgi:prolyl-tRNA synthetase
VRLSTLLAPTLREAPAEADVASHVLMLRAGLMRKLASGFYTLLPLGWRAAAKVEQIVRQEMDRQGAQELRLPVVQPAELWEETGRWAEYGDEMWRLKDRHGRLFCLGPTHEEVITDLVRSTIRSYRQLPVTLYQIQVKYRDEVRPRFGVMRAREFVMKDAYSFDRDEAGLRESYRRMYEAYSRIFTRCGLEFAVVEADSGAIGGSETHEFMALADSGEAGLVHCPACGYAADIEKAEGVPASAAPDGAAVGPRQRVATPGMHSIEEVAAYLGRSPQRLAKTLFYWCSFGDGRRTLVAAVVRGDRQVNEIKLRRATGALQVGLADAGEVMRLTGAPVGSAGPVGLRGAAVLTDREVALGHGWIVGAGEEGWHLVDVEPGRDFDPGEPLDLRLAVGGDPCPRCGAPLLGRRGVEVGQVFQLGTKYSSAMGAAYLDESGRERPCVMGCYGIGVTRTVAAIIEQRHDADGIVWPLSVAPFHVEVVPVPAGPQGATAEAAERLHAQLSDLGVEVLVDDRDERPGVKFKDADLYGVPIRVTVGRALAEGKVEVMDRATRAVELWPVEETARRLADRVAHGLEALQPR